MDLGIIIVSYNVRDLLAACLHSVYESLARSRLDGRVIVVDNASADGSADMVRERFPQAQLVASPHNLGFAAANNLGMRSVALLGVSTSERSNVRTLELSSPRYVLLLNPDTELRGDALALLARFLDEHPAAGAVGAKLVYPDGRLQHGAFRFPGVMQTFFDFFPVHPRLTDSRLNGRYPRAAYAGGPFRIDHPLGACLMLRAEAIRQVGGLDEQFFMYCEEIDWCLRMKRAGWQIYCVPQAEVVHHAGQSTGQVRDAMFVALWRSRLRLYAKHYSRPRQWAIRQVARLGLRARPAGESGLGASREVLEMLRG